MSQQPQSGQQAPSSHPQPTSLARWCQHCGAENSPNASFCTNCGAPLIPVSQPQPPQAPSQGKQQANPHQHQPQPKKSRRTTKGFWHRLSGENKVAIIVAIIGAVGVILAATIPVVTQLVRPSPNPNGLTSPVTITTSPPPNVYPPIGWKLAYDDPLKSNSSGYWHVSSHGLAGNEGICTFANDVYEVITIKSDLHRCINNIIDYTAFAAEVRMTIVNGDEGGIEFREDYNTGNYYLFWISSAGTYGLEIWENGTFSQTLSSGSSAAISTGLNQPNIIAVVAQGNTFHLYVNDQLINAASDKASSYGHGSIALEAYSGSWPLLGHTACLQKSTLTRHDIFPSRRTRKTDCCT